MMRTGRTWSASRSPAPSSLPALCCARFSCSHTRSELPPCPTSMRSTSLGASTPCGGSSASEGCPVTICALCCCGCCQRSRLDGGLQQLIFTGVCGVCAFACVRTCARRGMCARTDTRKCVLVCVLVCVHASVRECIHACVHACVRACAVLTSVRSVRADLLTSLTVAEALDSVLPLLEEVVSAEV